MSEFGIPKKLPLHVGTYTSLLIVATTAYSWLLWGHGCKETACWPLTSQAAALEGIHFNIANKTGSHRSTPEMLVQTIYGTNISGKPIYRSFTHSNLYYIPTTTVLDNVYNGILFDDKRKIVSYSSFNVLGYDKTSLEEGLKPLVTMADREANRIEHKVVLITTWPPSWGHLIDSICVLTDFFYRHRLNELGYKVMLLVPECPWAENVLEAARLLLGSHFVNLQELEDPKRLLSFQEVILIQHAPSSVSFLSFPQNVVNILQNQWNDGIENDAYNVFLTRSTTNVYRILENHGEIEHFFRDHGFVVIDPESHSNSALFNLLKNARNIVITNGSALSSLIFFRLTSRIFCLNSAGYQPQWRQGIASERDLPSDANEREDFEKRIWKNAVSRFNFTYVDAFMNRISDEQLNSVIAAVDRDAMSQNATNQ